MNPAIKYCNWMQIKNPLEGEDFKIGRNGIFPEIEEIAIIRINTTVASTKES